jgi:hypothetical protein
MLDTPYQLTQKLILKLIRHPCAQEETDVLSIVQDMLHDALKGKYGLAPDRDSFVFGGHFESEDGTVRRGQPPFKEWKGKRIKRFGLSGCASEIQKQKA